jgi:hypothetical protein
LEVGSSVFLNYTGHEANYWAVWALVDLESECFDAVFVVELIHVGDGAWRVSCWKENGNADFCNGGVGDEVSIDVLGDAFGVQCYEDGAGNEVAESR